MGTCLVDDMPLLWNMRVPQVVTLWQRLPEHRLGYVLVCIAFCHIGYIGVEVRCKLAEGLLAVPGWP